MTITFSPPYTSLTRSVQTLQEKGFALLSSDDFFSLSEHSRIDWEILAHSWHHLTEDQYLKDGGKYRQRKHASLTFWHSLEILINPVATEILELTV